ncbi:MAG: sensor domain-containing diguanylate cyclase [Spirochaetaceae bacterium]|nr:MAG: sensor domain-containing diguanylate cyclase [Spirochaetaceae bacterium]
MSSEPEELQQMHLELGSQDLKEIIEIGSQITAQLDVENIVRNVVLSFVAKFQAASVTCILPNDLDEKLPNLYYFKGLKQEKIDLQIPSLIPILSFLGQHEYNQISFAYFKENFDNEQVIHQFEVIQPDIIIPLRTDKGVGGLILLPPKQEGGPYTLLDIQYITQIVRFASIAIENANLYWQATTDRMTKLFSHHFFQQNLEEEIARAHRYGTTLSLLMFDIDHFKKFNDTYGHLQGDLIIKEIANILRGSVRTIDFTARYGGEEFAVILPEVSAKGAAVVAERIRKTIEKNPFHGDEEPLYVTVSIGVAAFKPARMRSASQLIAEADKALYQSKEMGRNRVTVQK